MSGDSFNPDEGGKQIEVVNPDGGNTEIAADPEPEDAMDAAELEAAGEFAAEDNADTEEAEPVAEDADTTHPDDAVSDDPAEDGEDARAEDGDAPEAVELDLSSLPEPLRKQFDEKVAALDAKTAGADKYFGTKARELAAKGRELDALLSEARASSTEGRNTPTKEVEQPPPLPTGENVTQEAYNEAMTRQTAWFAKQNREEILAEMKSSGEFVPAGEFAESKRQSEISALSAEIEALPGYTEDVQGLILHALESNPMWDGAMKTHPRETLHELARQGIAHVGAQKAQTTAAENKKEKILEQSTAASRATPRVTTPKGATSEDVFAKQGFKTEDERMDYAEKHVREEIGG